jgi:putative membrane protein
MEASALLAAINACFNGLSACLVAAGWVAIKRGERTRHRNLMVGALVSSSLFLVGYLTRMGLYGSTAYTGTGFTRTLYLVILFSHMVLAAVVVPLVLRTVFLAYKQRFEQHRRIARWTLPIWLYVSVTGVLVYLMLYRF